jgi:hypothetical protein
MVMALQGTGADSFVAPYGTMTSATNVAIIGDQITHGTAGAGGAGAAAMNCYASACSVSFVVYGVQ